MYAKQSAIYFMKISCSGCNNRNREWRIGEGQEIWSLKQWQSLWQVTVGAVERERVTFLVAIWTHSNANDIQRKRERERGEERGVCLFG